jgi:uncharacterized membrane protein YedE/YeeE
MTGYCPGTGLACAAAGRIDALITVAGMFVGAVVYIMIYPAIVAPMDKIANYGKVTLPEMTQTNAALWVVPIVVVGTVILILTAPKKR